LIDGTEHMQLDIFVEEEECGGEANDPGFNRRTDLEWDHLMVNQLPIYSPDNFAIALAVLPIAFIVGLVAVLLVRETNCQPIEESNTAESN